MVVMGDDNTITANVVKSTNIPMNKVVNTILFYYDNTSEEENVTTIPRWKVLFGQRNLPNMILMK